MSRKPDGRPGTRDFRRLDFCVTVFIVTLILAGLASLLSLPLFAIFASVAQFGEVLGFVIDVLITILTILGFIIYLVYSLLAGDWGWFIMWLPVLLGWLRSLGLL
jgi:hypothetical protein